MVKDNLFELDGQIALVTGAASGLGKQIAWGMASFGADLILSDINYEGVENEAKKIEKQLGRKTVIFQVDVTKIQEVQDMVQKATDIFGKIDISVNNPGVNCRKSVLDLNLEEYERVLDVNLKGVFICAKEIGKIMVQQKKGKMINMSSIFGHVAMPNQAAYASSKGAILQLTKVLALEWAPYNVQVNALAPAHHKTSLAKQLMDNKDIYKDILNRIPQQRFAGEEEIIGPAIFLASKASDFVTGASLIVDGGWTAQ